MKKILYFTLIAGVLFSSKVSLNAQNPVKTELTASISGVSNGPISMELLLKTGLIQCSDLKTEITGFTLSAQKKDDLIEFNGTGNILTVGMKDFIKTLKPGSKVIIENILVNSEQEKAIKLPAIILTLK
ncbi:MAG: GldM family protein [Bacteroidota bacterium]